MERVHVLIDRLAAQKARAESAAQLLATVQLLQQELLAQQAPPAVAPSKKIAVIMPARPVIFDSVAEAPVVPPVEQKEEATPEPAPVAVPAAIVAPTPPAPPPVPQPLAQTPKPAPTQSYMLRRPSITELMQEKGEQKEPEAKPEPVRVTPPPATLPPVVAMPTPTPALQFNAVEEAPTLLQHTPQSDARIHTEINQIIHGDQRSLNDKLNEQKKEVAHLLQDTPIKDLRKAIGINDKFLFVAELFNNDEAAFDRSVKTINNFHVLQEAEYWINRELKLRLGWNDTKDSVQHFYQLVRRRFS